MMHSYIEDGPRFYWCASIILGGNVGLKWYAHIFNLDGCTHYVLVVKAL